MSMLIVFNGLYGANDLKSVEYGLYSVTGDSFTTTTEFQPFPEVYHVLRPLQVQNNSDYNLITGRRLSFIAADITLLRIQPSRKP